MNSHTLSKNMPTKIIRRLFICKPSINHKFRLIIHDISNRKMNISFCYHTIIIIFLEFSAIAFSFNFHFIRQIFWINTQSIINQFLPICKIKKNMLSYFAFLYNFPFVLLNNGTFLHKKTTMHKYFYIKYIASKKVIPMVKLSLRILF